VDDPPRKHDRNLLDFVIPEFIFKRSEKGNVGNHPQAAGTRRASIRPRCLLPRLRTAVRLRNGSRTASPHVVRLASGM